MMIVESSLFFETHSWSEDNEQGVASGWRHSRLSARGRGLAREVGERYTPLRRADGHVEIPAGKRAIAAVFTSDLARAVETANLAFADTDIPILHDWRLRECDYGEWNGMRASELHADRRRYLDEPYPGGESWRQAIERVGRFLHDLPLRWEDRPVLVIGHVATRWALDHLLNGVALAELEAADFAWREGWEYRLR